ncbi:D-2-hydroxyacid dehydrogenase [Mariniblastus fucicola]|uniref:Glycerate dehydrogenase n=1 Tax=Mariniblastus fucicola TaxID=980251 RepID=A0A5B9P729_9BACT|nr:D-2-hydroxyacid dehydrogenase [Mariniblastus fucicola]QEG22114.1 Glycerate dehydrogenase [Mariniblastus fucicola]
MNIVVLDGRALEPELQNWSPIENAIPGANFSWYPTTDADDVVSRSADAEILVINKIKLGEAQFSQLPNLKLIAVSATGYDVVDLAAAAKHGVTVCNVPIYSTQSVAQHVFAMLLEVLHRPYEHDQAIRRGDWQAAGQFTFWLSPLTELAGKKFGVVGFGRIGQATAKLAQAFGMQIVISSRTKKEVAGFESATWCDIDELFQTSDVVSLHCPQTDSNRGFVNQKLLSQMKPTAVLVNTARGGLIDEAELAQCLNDGLLAAACLDVATSEPINPDNPLLTAKNCLLMPHIAWTTVEARSRLMNYVAENIQAFVSGNPINVL